MLLGPAALVEDDVEALVVPGAVGALAGMAGTVAANQQSAHDVGQLAGGGLGGDVVGWL